MGPFAHLHHHSLHRRDVELAHRTFTSVFSVVDNLTHKTPGLMRLHHDERLLLRKPRQIRRHASCENGARFATPWLRPSTLKVWWWG